MINMMAFIIVLINEVPIVSKEGDADENTDKPIIKDIKIIVAVVYFLYALFNIGLIYLSYTYIDKTSSLFAYNNSLNGIYIFISTLISFLCIAIGVMGILDVTAYENNRKFTKILSILKLVVFSFLIINMFIKVLEQLKTQIEVNCIIIINT